MGVYIKGMEMPKDRPQLLWVYPNGKALPVQSDVDPWKELQAVPVPPHGRLIDADALAEHKFVCIPRVDLDGKDVGRAYRLGWNSAIEAVMENAKTIIGGE